MSGFNIFQQCSYNSLKQIQLQRLNTQEIIILKMSCPATSYVTATFHPTIGQCAHQSFSNTTTHDMGMIPTRNNGTTTGSHIDIDVSKFSQAKTTFGFIRLLRRWKG